eukprot:TRINITY_DN102_c0_g4_i1.p6 TRINITY_DN102_c0_g4~~TRINITY_DN102_c0_g4_i1.p6  ORF type:complete len:105 (+),score=7.16 TRINITY_DN102_c0_g4_i1:537-851(+)
MYWVTLVQVHQTKFFEFLYLKTLKNIQEDMSYDATPKQTKKKFFIVVQKTELNDGGVAHFPLDFLCRYLTRSLTEQFDVSFKKAIQRTIEESQQMFLIYLYYQQ